MIKRSATYTAAPTQSKSAITKRAGRGQHRGVVEGIATGDELRSLAEAGAAAAILGMALYTGALDGRAIAREFSS